MADTPLEFFLVDEEDNPDDLRIPNNNQMQ
jgi:hypothetical protein